MDLREAIETAGGFRAVGEKIGTPPNTIYYWLRRRKVPAEKTRALAAALNVEPHVLRPDLYDAPAPERAA